MSEQLSGRALDRAIAEALGLVTQFQPHNEWWYLTESEDRGRQFTPIPTFHADANATLAVCAARGWALRFEIGDGVVEVLVPYPDEYDTYATKGYSSTILTCSWQEAAARALLAAITAEAAQP